MPGKIKKPGIDPIAEVQPSLRREAEARLAREAGGQAERPANELVHELQVHQIELEMQNEELRRTQVALEESRDRYVDFYDFAPAGYITLNGDALIVDINLSGAALLGKERSKLVGRRFVSYVAPDDGDAWHRYFMSAKQSDGKLTGELCILRNDGSRVIVQIDSIRLVREGAVPVVRLSLTDISALRQMEAALRESEMHRHLLEQREIIQTALDGFWMLDSWSGRILEVNDIYCKMMGYAREELLTMNVSDVEANETPEEVKAHLRQVMETGYDRFETRQRHKRGHLVDVEVSAARSSVNGGVNYAFFRDISERKRNEEVLRKSRNQLETFIKQAPICIAMFDRGMNYLATSGRWAEEYGGGRESLVGLNLYISCPVMPAEWVGIHQQCLAGAAMEKDEDSWIRCDGTEHWLRWAVRPWIDENTRIGGIIISTADITEEKKLEAEINEWRNSQEQLQKLQIATQTAAAIAHELNQPLLAIASYSEAALMLLQAEQPSLDKVRRAIDGAGKQALRAGESIRELLEFLSLKEYPPEDFDLNGEIVKAIDIAGREHELKFRSDLRLDEGMPLVRANRMHFEKVLLNLLHNGIDAMRQAGVPQPAITVTVRTKKEASVAMVTVQDNGPGVRKEDVERLFEPFFTTKENGIGMGLTISRALIEESGGQLWIDPHESPGAIFHLTLPFAT
ncbi:MAG: PAS domain S-box protein [Gammaproteobacteria bacterium]|nr:PAS domain S-box protein [Gammaproteobacteria bacterium]MBU1480079.1 PAS domain S-box protein [Gammaproteobacteria bacterium]